MSAEDLHCSFGPVISMPGALHSVPPGTPCDRHPKRLAVNRLQGETDSFGAEYLCLCQRCIDEIRARNVELREIEQYCEWHRGMGLDVRPHRDFEEGSAGRLYSVCAACRRQESERLTEELADDLREWDA
ncbi:hypothetical protein [Variovorax sp. 3P27G3]|jgi:hypothetical protein|uniref:hypothetical protein n=1 Tax=Variovorax sp. 3P27G3 TaxID=2502214 RepID=UPI0010F8846B|nr:hypothetical protein [Variovorax sp. 3P27G3]